MATATMVPGRLLKVAQVIEKTAYCKGYVYTLIERGVLPAVRIGRSIRVPEAALDKLLADNLSGGGN